MDINEELDEIIRKYHLDEHYPYYAAMGKAKKLIKNLANEWQEGEKVACISIGYNQNVAHVDELHFRKDLTSAQQESIDFITLSLNETRPANQVNRYDWYRCNFEILEKVNWKEYARVYVISNQGRNFLSLWLRQHEVRYLDIYDYFSLHGIQYDVGMKFYEFISEYRNGSFFLPDYEVPPTLYEIYLENSKFQGYEEKAVKILSAQKCYFLSVAVKNFKVAEKWLSELKKLGGSTKKYEDAYVEIDRLLKKIKVALNNRSQKDIIALWVDCVRYDAIDLRMPFVSSLKNRSIWFDRIYTLTGYTHEVLRGLFTGKKLIDDKTQDVKELNLTSSSLLQLLEEHGYDVKVLGELQYYFAECYKDNDNSRVYGIESELMWGALRYQLQSSRSCFLLVHIMNIHPETLNIEMLDHDVLVPYGRYRKAYSVVDCQLEFYTGLQGAQATTMIFSDHQVVGFWPRQRVFLSIYGASYKNRRIKGLVCSLDFQKIVGQILNDGDVNEQDLTRDFVEIQGINVRSAKKFPPFQEIVAPARPRFWPVFRGYRGAITDKYVYLYFSDGREWLSRVDEVQPDPSWYKRLDDIYDEKLLPQMRKLAKVDFDSKPEDYGDISGYYNSLSEAVELNYEYNYRKILLINSLVSKINSDKIALYLGSTDSYEFYLALSPENRKKIIGIIQWKPKCPFSSPQISHFPLEKVKEHGVKVIIVTDRNMDDKLRQFVDKGTEEINIFCIYGFFALNGYYTRFKFYDFVVEAQDEKPVTKHAMPYFFHYATRARGDIAAVVLLQGNEEHSRECLYRLFRQLMDGIRIICVDTGQGQNDALLDEYGKADCSMEIIKTESAKLHDSLNWFVGALEEKYVMFLSADDMMLEGSFPYLCEITDKVEAEVVASFALFAETGEGQSALVAGEQEWRRRAEILRPATQARYEELSREKSPGLLGTHLYSTKFLREQGLQFMSAGYGGLEAFYLKALLAAEKYVKVASPVCVRYGE